MRVIGLLSCVVFASLAVLLYFGDRLPEAARTCLRLSAAACALAMTALVASVLLLPGSSEAATGAGIWLLRVLLLPAWLCGHLVGAGEAWVFSVPGIAGSSVFWTFTGFALSRPGGWYPAGGHGGRGREERRR